MCGPDLLDEYSFEIDHILGLLLCKNLAPEHHNALKWTTGVIFDR